MKPKDGPIGVRILIVAAALFVVIAVPFLLKPDEDLLGSADETLVLVSPHNEADNGLQNKTYTIAMARTPDPHSASCQFFINVRDNDFLDFRAPTPQEYGYCVFGRVAEGQDVVDRIRKVTTGRKGMHSDVPVDDVVILKAEVID